MQGDGAGGLIGSVVFTSGSTGRPKGAVQAQTTLTGGAVRVAQAVGFGPQDRLLTAVPWSHDYGWTQVLAMYVLGLTLVLRVRRGWQVCPRRSSGTGQRCWAACRVALAPHERPRRYHLRAALPLTASGKVDLPGLTREVFG